MENEGLDLEKILKLAEESLGQHSQNVNTKQGARTMRPSIDVTYRYFELDEDKIEEYEEESEKLESAGLKPTKFNIENYYKEIKDSDVTIFLDDIKRYSPSTIDYDEFKNTTLVVLSDGSSMNLVTEYSEFKELLNGLYRIA